MRITHFPIRGVIVIFNVYFITLKRREEVRTSE